VTDLQNARTILETTATESVPHALEISNLESNRIDPKFLYITLRQAELWRQVSLRHSPIHGNPEFVRVYREAFGKILDQFCAEKISLVGLGCGTGAKELELFSTLKVRGRAAVFSAVDVSRELVSESAQKLEAMGADLGQSMVCDLARTPLLAEWLDRQNPQLPRLMTFFGLVPNLMPLDVARIFHTLLRPGDALLVSVHLAPVHGDEAENLPTAMGSVLPQYDNPETLAWLTAALENWDLTEYIHAPKMSIGQVNEIPAFLAYARWKSSEPFEKWSHRFFPDPKKPLRLFYSLRYTPSLFEDFLRREGFSFERLAITACRQEAIWLVRWGGDVPTAANV